MSSLSAGAIIRDLLLMEQDIANMVGENVFPVVADTAKLPYIYYRRVSLEPVPTKSRPYNDDTGIEVTCVASTYDEGIELAERVRAALDGCAASHVCLRMRSCLLVDSEEDWEADAFVQKLVFRVKIEGISRKTE